MKFYYLEDLKYDQYQNELFNTHYINNIIIKYETDDLKIKYIFNKDSLNLMFNILFIDYINFSYIDEIYINNIKINENRLNFINDTFEETLDSYNKKYIDFINILMSEDMEIKKKIRISDNIITISFKKNIEAVIDYIWLMKLTRYITNVDNEDEYYLNLFLKKKEGKCDEIHLINELKKKIL